MPAILANPGSQLWGAPLVNAIVVGATKEDGTRGDMSQNADYLTTYAPGSGITIPSTSDYQPAAGTSYGKPLFHPNLCANYHYFR